MNKTANRQAICDVLMEKAADDRDIVVLCSDSRGSASLAPFAEAFPDQFIETGIAEMSLVSTAAGLAKCGKKAFAASPACFLSTRSMEQIKVDVAYSGTNVKLIGISGGVSYGALGMTHHSTQDIATIASIPGIEVYLPSDRFQTKKLMEKLLESDKPAYIRVGRNAVEDIYDDNLDFELGKSISVKDGDDVAVIACGEMVYPALRAAKLLEKENISVRVIDMYSLKPIDDEAVIKAAQECGKILTAEEHVKVGGLGSMVSLITAENCPVRTVNMTLPDAPVISGNSSEIFAYYGLDEKGISDKIRELVKS